MGWNPVLNIVKQIKLDYEKHTGSIDTYDFKTWFEVLNRQEYNSIFDCLQMRQKGNVLLIRYGLAEIQKGLWKDKDSIYRECRSVVIDLEAEELILTPFRKFFNLNEVEENEIDKVIREIQNANIVEITDKLDGSMQSARYYNGEIFMAGSMAIDKNDSWRLEDGYSKLTEKHKAVIKKNPDYTFIFEYISVRDAHVVKYDKSEEGLYLIGIRNSKTGEQLPYKDLKVLSEVWDIPMAKIENYTLNEIIELSKTLRANEKEGWILNIDGHLIKIKCDDYVQLHRLLDKVSSINVIIENVAEDRIDDLLSKVPDTYKDRVINSANKLLEYKNDMNIRIDEIYNLAPKENKKDFMIWLDNNCDLDIKSYVRNKYLGKEYNILKKGKTGYKKASELGISI